MHTPICWVILGQPPCMGIPVTPPPNQRSTYGVMLPRMADVLHLELLSIVPRLFFPIALVAWLAVAAGLARAGMQTLMQRRWESPGTSCAPTRLDRLGWRNDAE